MTKLLEIAVGVVPSIGGFLDAGAMAISAQVGACFRFQLIWATLLSTICAIFRIEMSSREPGNAAERNSYSYMARGGTSFSPAISVLASVGPQGCRTGR
jgi:hypothetical protein